MYVYTVPVDGLGLPQKIVTLVLVAHTGVQLPVHVHVLVAATPLPPVMCLEATGYRPRLGAHATDDAPRLPSALCGRAPIICPRLVILKPCVRIDSGMMFCVDIISITSAKYQTGAKQGSISNEPLVRSTTSTLLCTSTSRTSLPRIILMAGCYSHLLEPLICCKTTVQLPTNHQSFRKGSIDLTCMCTNTKAKLRDSPRQSYFFIPCSALGAVCAHNTLYVFESDIQAHKHLINNRNDSSSKRFS